MTTAYQIIYQKFLGRITDIKLALKLTSDVNLAESEMYDYLESACASFTKCKQDLEDRDNVLKQFNFAITPLEKEIIVKYMIVGWMEKFISSILNLEDSLGSADFKVYSAANALDKKLKYQKEMKLSIDDDIRKYGYDLNRSFDNLC